MKLSLRELPISFAERKMTILNTERSVLSIRATNIFHVSRACLVYTSRAKFRCVQPVGTDSDRFKRGLYKLVMQIF